MTQGNNLRFDVIRAVQLPDLPSGGASYSGTYVYRGVEGRMELGGTGQQELQQGLEMNQRFIISVRPGSLLFIERDVIEVVFPTDHNFYRRRLRVKDIDIDSIRTSDPRSHIELSCQIITESQNDTEG